MLSHVKPFLLIALFLSSFLQAVSVQEANLIAEKIWKNECGGTVEGLTHWNKGENFPSLGIGHFIWYPKGVKERFEETFPSLVHFLQEKGSAAPSWLKKGEGCPWSCREEFYHDIQSPKMASLRQFLFDTRHLQAIFIAARLEKSLPKMVEKLPPADRGRVVKNFHLLAKDAGGLYALIDYLNFKGEGTSPAETYKGQGWGLLQVLERMPPSPKDSLAEFVKAAKAVLALRVQNAPPERNEERWLKGWYSRLDTYLRNNLK